MNGFGEGTIKRIYRGLGIGTIKPDRGGEEIIFSSGAVKGGDRGFQDLGEGDRGKYHNYPETIGGRNFADDVWPA